MRKCCRGRPFDPHFVSGDMHLAVLITVLFATPLQEQGQICTGGRPWPPLIPRALTSCSTAGFPPGAATESRPYRSVRIHRARGG